VQLQEGPQTIPTALRRPPMATHRVLIVSGLVIGLLFVAIAAVTATNYVYQNGSAPSGTYSTSAINDIYGGYVESNDGGLCYMCNTKVQTTLSWWPYYAYASAQGGRFASLSHGVQSNSRSRCTQWWSGGAGTMHKYCYYRS